MFQIHSNERTRENMLMDKRENGENAACCAKDSLKNDHVPSRKIERTKNFPLKIFHHKKNRKWETGVIVVKKDTRESFCT